MWIKTGKGQERNRKQDGCHSKKRKYEFSFQYIGFFIHGFTWCDLGIDRWYFNATSFLIAQINGPNLPISQQDLQMPLCIGCYTPHYDMTQNSPPTADSLLCPSQQNAQGSPLTADSFLLPLCSFPQSAHDLPLTCSNYPFVHLDRWLKSCFWLLTHSYYSPAYLDILIDGLSMVIIDYDLTIYFINWIQPSGQKALVPESFYLFIYLFI